MRIRTIKPEFWTDEDLSLLSADARLMAIALLNYSDDEGYFLANPILVKSSCFPFADGVTKIKKSLEELEQIGYIKTGTDESGKSIGLVVKFSKHQRVNRPNESKLKQKTQFSDDSLNTHDVNNESSCMCHRCIRNREEEKEQGTGNGAKAILESQFNEFWNAYPRKVSKPDAINAFTKAIVKTTIGTILKAIDGYKKTDQWSKDNGKFIPHPASFLNKERWLDRIEPQTTAIAGTKERDHIPNGRIEYVSTHSCKYCVAVSLRLGLKVDDADSESISISQNPVTQGEIECVKATFKSKPDMLKYWNEQNKSPYKGML